jgi:hypothetical protein
MARRRKVKRIRRNKLSSLDRTNLKQYYRMRSRGNPHSRKRIDAMRGMWEEAEPMGLNKPTISDEEARLFLGLLKLDEEEDNFYGGDPTDLWNEAIIPKWGVEDFDTWKKEKIRSLGTDGIALDMEEGESEEVGDTGSESLDIRAVEVSAEDPSFQEASEEPPPKKVPFKREALSEQSDAEEEEESISTPTPEMAQISKKRFNKGTAFDLWREKKFKLRSARIQKELGPFFFFLQLNARTLPLPSADEWIKAIKDGEKVFKQDGEWLTPSGEAFPLDYGKLAFRQNAFLYVRNQNTVDAPTQMYLPSQNPVAYETKKRKGGPKHWVPSLEFISRPDLSPDWTWPKHFLQSGAKWGLPEANVTGSTKIGGDNYRESPHGNRSWYQMLHNYMVVLREKGRTGKFGAYGVLIFEEVQGKPVLKAYIPPQMPSFLQLGIKSAQQMRLPSKAEMQKQNPRRRRRVNSRPKRVIKIVRKVKRR